MGRPKKIIEEKEELSKKARIEALKKELNKTYGIGTVINGTDESMNIDFIPTGSIGLDIALGIGGLPKGRIIEVFGENSSGKTTLSLEVIKEAHKNPDSYCAFLDAEHSLDIFYAQKIGVDLTRLEISQPNSGEETLEIADRLIKSKEFDVIVIDSVAALVPKKELEGEMGDATIGLQARMMSQACRKLTSTISHSNTICIFLNQMREKIGIMYGSPSVTTGGKALAFYASVRLEIVRSTTKDNSVMNGETKLGNLVTIKVVKNKVGPPFRKCELNIMYNEGFDEFEELVNLSVATNIIKKSGQWYSYEDNIIAQGKEKLREFFKENEDFFFEIKKKVLDSYKPKEFEPTEDDKENQQETTGEEIIEAEDVSNISGNMG